MKNIKSFLGFSDKKKKVIKDIKVDNIQSNSDKSISMLLDKEYSVSNIIAIGNNEKLKLKFSQQNRNLIVYGINTLNQEISGKVKFDVYAIVNGEKIDYYLKMQKTFLSGIDILILYWELMIRSIFILAKSIDD